MVSALGRNILNLFSSLGAALGYLQQVGGAIFRRPFRLKEVIKQIEFIASKSMLIVLFCVASAAMVTILESSYHMKLVVQSDSMVPGFASLLILRELGSVVMALLLTSRVGAGMAAEISTMQITEQIDALKMLGLNPHRFLVVPRFIAGLFSGFVLSLFSNIFCLYVAMGVSQVFLGYTAGAYISMTRTFVHFQDLIFAVIKGTVFGGVIPLVACYCGFRCKGGAEGVGTSTTQSVVISSVLIIVLDFLMSALFTNFY